MKLVTNNTVVNEPRTNDILRIEVDLRTAVRTARRTLGREHVTTALRLIQLGDFLHHEKRFAEAESVYRHAIDVYETLGIGHELLTAIALRSLSLALCAQDLHVEADAISGKATALISDFQ